jgi:hypothetical protein
MTTVVPPDSPVPPIRGVHIPAGARLPLVVTDEWLAAVTAARWQCLCQRYGDQAKCTHVGPCDKGAADRLTLDQTDRVVCTPCAQARAKKAADHERARNKQLMALSQTDLFDLLTEGS